MHDIFIKTVLWIDKNIINNSKISCVIPTTIIGIVSNALSQLIGVIDNKNDFLVRCIYGLSSNIHPKVADKIALKLAQLANITIPTNNPSLIYWNSKRDVIESFTNNDNIDADIWKHDNFSLKSLPTIRTSNVSRHLKIITQFLKYKYSFIVVGTEGCGKTAIVKEAFKLHIGDKAKQNKKIAISSIDCNAYTKAKHIIRKLYHCCSSFNSNNGKVLRPNNCDSLILYLKDINLPKPDNYNTSQIIELLQQFIAYQGFYDENLDFVHLEHIQFVFSMNNANTLGCHPLSKRFTAHVGIIAIDEPNRDQLNIIYSNYYQVVSSICQLNSQQTQILKLSASPAMIDIYYEIKKEFKRDEHRHLLFTLRDLTKWCFNLIRYSLKTVGIINAWYNEGMRLFYDRMPNQNSKQKFESVMRSIMNKYKLPRKQPKQAIFYTTFVNEIEKDDDMKEEDNESSKCIQQIGLSLTSISMDDFRNIISQKIRLYEKEYNELHLILFEEFLQNLSILDRIISHGFFHNTILIGNSGIGRKIIIQLLCYIHRIECLILRISQKYSGKNQFANTLKNILKSTGIENKKMLLYIEDCQLIDNVMYEYLNQLITTGDVIGLFEDKELDALLNPIKEQYKQNGINKYRSLYHYFISRVCNNLYIVLSLDPKNKTFPTICEINPCFINKCNIFWMGNQWQNKSMIQYAKSQLKQISNYCKNDEESQELLQKILTLHNNNIHHGSSPRSLMVLVSIYKKIFQQKLSQNQELAGHLISGLNKLNEAEEVVDKLSIKATKQRELLKEKQKEADNALNEITKSMTKANERRRDAETLKIKLSEQEIILNERKKNVENELSEIQPLIDEARSAVGKIRKDSINELRMLRLPPEAINDVLSGVLILMGNFDTSWQSIKSFLSKPSVKQEIIQYDARNITPIIRKKAQRLLSNKQESFNPKRIQRVSVAAAPLAAWFKANIKYSVILEDIAPLQNELNNAKNDINKAIKDMNNVENELQELDDQVSSLKLNFSSITSEAESLKISLKNVENTLEKAQTLLKKLFDEKNRWNKQINEIQNINTYLPYYSLIVSGFITYLGGYPEDIRLKSINKWKKLLLPSKLNENNNINIWNVLRFMNTESDLLQWKSNGLPDDQLSYENGMIILNTILYPFIIDPNGNATNWLKNHLISKNISNEIITQSDPRFMKQLELSVRFGKTIIITDIDNINPCLYPLLRKEIIKNGARNVISIGDKFIDYNDNFKLYLITRNSNFILPSRCKSLITELNFAVTKSGLESQLLSITLKSQKPELEIKKSKLLQNEEKYKLQLAKLEKELLQQLAMSAGNILENDSLIQSLNNTKIQSQNIKKALKESQIVQYDLNKQRDIYRTLAIIGSNSYFTIKSLQSLNNMYQFSLSTFLELFQLNLKHSSSKNSTNSTTQILQKLKNNFVSLVYRYISRSLFKSHRHTFGLYFVHTLYPDIFLENEWEYFIGEIISSNNNIKIPSWIQSDIKQSFINLSNNFPDFVSKCSFNKYSNEWRNWIKSNNPESSLSTHISSKISTISNFQQLLLLQTFRADRLLFGINIFIRKYLNTSSSSIVSLSNLYDEETSCNRPILFVTTPGADPSTELRELAHKIVGKDNYNEMAMGSGKQYDAINLIKICAEKGNWICLKNLHLVIPFCRELQQVLSSIEPNKDFRLWLTTESHINFPSILLQNSLKITCEPPPGLKQNLNRTLSLWSAEYISMYNNPIRSQLLFMLAWFHAIIQERRTYIPQGWSKYYEFNEADLRASMDIIDQIFNNKNNIISNISQLPWKLLWGLLSKAIYGGRIDNNMDEDILNSYLYSFFNSNIIGGSNNNNINNNNSNIPGIKWISNIPQSTRKSEYSNLINTVPDTDSPNIFGLPSNADNIASTQRIQKLLQSLKRLSVINVVSDVSSNDGLSSIRESQRKRILPLIQLWKSKTKNISFTPQESLNNINNNNNNPVLNAVILEVNKVLSLMNYISTSIHDIEKGLFGNIPLKINIISDISSLISGITPWSWNKIWNNGQGPSNPIIFISELIKRKEILEKWFNQLKDNTFWKSNISIGNCFYPLTFLNAFRQHTAHKLGVTMDELQFESTFNIKRDNDSTPILNIDNLYFQGCTFIDDGKTIKQVSSKDGALSKAGICYIYYKRISSTNNNTNKQSTKVPVYYSLDRSYKVFDISINIKDPSEWKLSGLACIMTNLY